MIFRSSFLAWLEIQIQQRQNNDEQLQWAKLLVNIVLTVDHHKLDSIFRDSWRNSIYRCVSMLLGRRKFCPGSYSDSELIFAVSECARDFACRYHYYVQAGSVG